MFFSISRLIGNFSFFFFQQLCKNMPMLYFLYKYSVDIISSLYWLEVFIFLVSMANWIVFYHIGKKKKLYLEKWYDHMNINALYSVSCQHNSCLNWIGFLTCISFFLTSARSPMSSHWTGSRSVFMSAPRWSDGQIFFRAAMKCFIVIFCSFPFKGKTITF